VSACSSGATTAPTAAPSESAAPSVAPSEAPSATPEPTTAYKPIKVGVVTDVGQLEDKSFNQNSNEGAQEAAATAGGTHDVIVTQQISDYAQNIQTFIDQGYDVIVTIGFLIGSDTAAAAKANPDVTFIGVDQGICVNEQGENDTTFTCAGDPAKLLPNYQGIVFAEQQPGYLAGIVAASLSQSGTVGAVGGTNVPAVVRYWRGYQNGATSVNPNIKVLYQETNPDPAKGFNDPATGKAIAQQFIGQGADVLFQIAGLTGQGVLEAACGAKIHGIGVDADQAETLPNLAPCIVTSAEKKLVKSVSQTIIDLAAGKDVAGDILYDAANDGIGASPITNVQLPDVQAKLDAVMAGMKAGTLKTCPDPGCGVGPK